MSVLKPQGGPGSIIMLYWKISLRQKIFQITAWKILFLAQVTIFWNRHSGLQLHYAHNLKSQYLKMAFVHTFLREPPDQKLRISWAKNRHKMAKYWIFRFFRAREIRLKVNFSNPFYQICRYSPNEANEISYAVFASFCLKNSFQNKKWLFDLRTHYFLIRFFFILKIQSDKFGW